MIKASDLFAIGYVAKTHGIRGEMNVSLDTEFNPEDFRFLIFDIDSIFVPFQVESSRGNAIANRLIALKGVETVDEAKTFVGKTVYVLLSELREHPAYNSSEEEEGLYLSDLVGYTLKDESGCVVGTITGFNDDTQNYLLEVLRPDGAKVLIPYVDEWILELNQDNKTLMVELPEGLLDD